MAKWHTYQFATFFHGVGLLPKRKLQGMFRPIRGGFFILQLHDELLYEVAEEDVVQVFVQCFPFYRTFGHSMGQAKMYEVSGTLPQPYGGSINVGSLLVEKELRVHSVTLLLKKFLVQGCFCLGEVRGESGALSWGFQSSEHSSWNWQSSCWSVQTWDAWLFPSHFQAAGEELQSGLLPQWVGWGTFFD